MHEICLDSNLYSNYLKFDGSNEFKKYGISEFKSKEAEEYKSGSYPIYLSGELRDESDKSNAEKYLPFLFQKREE